MRACRSCGAEVIWRRHVENERPMPIDAHPVDNGNLALVGERQYRVVGTDEGAGERYVSHYATCPDAGKWRRKGAS